MGTLACLQVLMTKDRTMFLKFCSRLAIITGLTQWGKGGLVTINLFLLSLATNKHLTLAALEQPNV